jgi:hypothetical protein
MAISPLAKKLLIKPGFRVAVVNAPPGYPELLEPLPEGAELAGEAGRDLDAIQVYVRDTSDLDRIGPAAFAAVKPDGLLWVCYPKGGQKAGTDLNRDILHGLMGERKLTGVTLVAVDDTWSAMRFRPTSG